MNSYKISFDFNFGTIFNQSRKLRTTENANAHCFRPDFRCLVRNEFYPAEVGKDACQD